MSNRFIKKLQGFTALADHDVDALVHATSNPRMFAPRKDLIREGD